ncbi:MAG: M42 family metallopeptidase [Anaerolineaceae bacterium]|nr:M42 family metallopeptidase [Anaerolineaceae bacterium]
MKELIKKLTEVTGPSGFEHNIRETIRTEIEDLSEEIKVDALGNLIVKLGKKSENGKVVMIAGHMDEIGIMASHIDDKGFIHFTNIGGVFPPHCVGSRVRFMDGTAGVIGLKIKSFKETATTNNLKLDNMFIDVGATSKENCPIKVGDVAAFDRPFEDLGDRVVAKAMDDRISAVVMIEAMKRLKETPNEIHFVFTVQEEVGLKGAKTSSYGINPDIGIAVDVTPCIDTPQGTKNELELGKGAAIKVRDSSLVTDPRVVDWMVKTAEKANIPYQYEVLLLGGTDGGAIQLTRAGVVVGVISIPTRYVHSPSEMVDINDVEASIQLLVELISNPIELNRG